MDNQVKLKSIFPNLTTLAFYDPLSQYIKLNYISNSDFKKLLYDVSHKNNNADRPLVKRVIKTGKSVTEPLTEASNA